MWTEIRRQSGRRKFAAAIVTVMAVFTLINGVMTRPVQASGGCCGVSDCRITGEWCGSSENCGSSWDTCCSSNCGI
jgi:hypothetical protein